MSAIYALPGVEDTVGLRVGCCITYGVLALAILFTDRVDSLGIGLGIVMVAMVVLFLVVVLELGLDIGRFAKGVLPISMPAGSTNIVLSLIGTTSIGFNLFLGGKMAEGKTLKSAQRGIAFSTVTGLIVSVLILIVGDGTYRHSKGVFTMTDLAGIIERIAGKAGIWIYAIGFIGAAFTSMLTTPLGVVITAESVFNIPPGDIEQKKKQQLARTSNGEEKMIHQTSDSSSSYPGRSFPKKYSNALMVIVVAIAVIVISFDAPSVEVILVAQVFYYE